MNSKTSVQVRPGVITAWIVLVAAFFRLSQAVLRWDEVSWLYSAYSGPTTDALANGEFWTALTQFTGLHPPLWNLLHGLSEIWYPVPILWLLGSASASIAAVWLVCRQSLWAGALLAVAPIQIHYSAEVNNYPLATLCLALVWTGHEKARTNGKWVLLTIATTASIWTHLLAGVAAVAAVLTLPSRVSIRVLITSLLLSTPLMSPLFELIADNGGAKQNAFKTDLVFTDYFNRFGPWALLSIPILIIGAKKRPDYAAAWGATGLVMTFMIWMRWAAPHQFPYQLFLGIPASLILAQSVQIVACRYGIILLVLGEGIWAVNNTGKRLLQLQSDQTRAIDLALDELTHPWTCKNNQIPNPDCTGDALVLLAPAGLNDDDKNRISTPLWRLQPWQSMPRIMPYNFSHHDHIHGQPRKVNGFSIYVHDEPRSTLEALIEAHHNVWVVVYEQGQRDEFTTQLNLRFGKKPEQIGPDLLFRLH